jgi:nucleotide-binding universal stress UspA family protein
MKILATFDRTPFSESIIPVLTKMAGLPEAEFTLLSIAHEPNVHARQGSISRPIAVSDAFGRAMPVIIRPPEPSFPEDKGQAIDRRLEELDAYLTEIAHRLPAGTKTGIEAHLSQKVAEVIIEHARARQMDVIVMATHSRAGIRHALFGSVAEAVVRSGAAPVLLVHPEQH